MSASWQVTQEKVETVVKKIIETARPRKVILFGSYVRGGLHADSDLDVMVVTADEHVNARKEGVRIRRALKGIMMPIDIVVVHEWALETYAETPGLIYREVLEKGRIVYDATETTATR